MMQSAWGGAWWWWLVLLGVVDWMVVSAGLRLNEGDVAIGGGGGLMSGCARRGSSWTWY